MAKLTKTQFNLTTVASLLGIVQAAAWSAMSVMCIIEYFISINSPLVPPPKKSSYMERYSYELYSYLLHSHASKDIINPFTFHIFMWVYFVSDMIWLLLSLMQLRSIYKLSNFLNVMKAWGVTVIFISCTDLFLSVLIIVQFTQFCLPKDGDAFCIRVLMPILTIVMRGYVLWIINNIFAYIVYKIIKSIQRRRTFNSKEIKWSSTIMSDTSLGFWNPRYCEAINPYFYRAQNQSITRF